MSFQPVRWNEPLIFDLLDRITALDVLCIHLSEQTSPDQLIWTPERNGKHSVKSFYLLDQIQRFNNHADKEQWKDINPLVESVEWMSPVTDLGILDNYVHYAKMVPILFFFQQSIELQRVNENAGPSRMMKLADKGWAEIRTHFTWINGALLQPKSKVQCSNATTRRTGSTSHRSFSGQWKQLEKDHTCLSLMWALSMVPTIHHGTLDFLSLTLDMLNLFWLTGFVFVLLEPLKSNAHYLAQMGMRANTYESVFWKAVTASLLCNSLFLLNIILTYEKRYFLMQRLFNCDVMVLWWFCKGFIYNKNKWLSWRSVGSGRWWLECDLVFQSCSCFNLGKWYGRLWREDLTELV